MSVTKVADQVRGILTREDVGFTENEAGTGFQVPYKSAAAVLSVYGWGDSTVIEVYAWVLQGVDVSDGREAAILRLLNARNRSSKFGMLWLDEEKGAIALEYHLLADELDGIELMNALRAVATRADDLDDELIRELGTGERWEDVARSEDEGEPTMST